MKLEPWQSLCLTTSGIREALRGTTLLAGTLSGSVFGSARSWTLQFGLLGGPGTADGNMLQF